MTEVLTPLSAPSMAPEAEPAVDSSGVDALMAMFPDYDRVVIECVLQHASNNLEAAATQLLELSSTTSATDEMAAAVPMADSPPASPDSAPAAGGEAEAPTDSAEMTAAEIMAAAAQSDSDAEAAIALYHQFARELGPRGGEACSNPEAYERFIREQLSRGRSSSGGSRSRSDSGASSAGAPAGPDVSKQAAEMFRNLAKGSKSIWTQMTKPKAAPRMREYASPLMAGGTSDGPAFDATPLSLPTAGTGGRVNNAAYAANYSASSAPPPTAAAAAAMTTSGTGVGGSYSAPLAPLYTPAAPPPPPPPAAAAGGDAYAVTPLTLSAPPPAVPTSSTRPQDVDLTI